MAVTHSDFSVIMANSIFALSAEGIWFASVFCTQMMFCFVDIHDQPEPLVLEGNLEMSMHLWHQLVVIPTTQYVTEQHSMPYFARKAMRCLNLSGSSNTAIALHVGLLVQAWKELLRECRLKRVGPDTFQEIKKWHRLMSKTACSSLFRAAPDDVKTQFKELLETDLSSDVALTGRQEHPHFSHEILFLRIAHMIFFYCKNDLRSGFPNHNDAEKVVEVDFTNMMRWERLSGQLFVDIFSLNGLSDETDDSDTDEFANQFDFLQLPFEKLDALMNMNNSPSFGHLHHTVSLAFHEKVQRNILNSSYHDNHPEGDKLHLILTGALSKFKKEYNDKFKSRKGYRFWYHRNRNPSKSYYKKQRYEYLRDIFIMGSESYHHKRNTAIGRARGDIFAFEYPRYNAVEEVVNQSNQETSDESVDESEEGTAQEL